MTSVFIRRGETGNAELCLGARRRLAGVIGSASAAPTERGVTAGGGARVPEAATEYLTAGRCRALRDQGAARVLASAENSQKFWPVSFRPRERECPYLGLRRLTVLSAGVPGKLTASRKSRSNGAHVARQIGSDCGLPPAIDKRSCRLITDCRF